MRSIPQNTSMTARGPLMEKLRVKPWLRDTPKSILFKNANIVHPGVGKITPNSFVLIHNGLIAHVGTGNAPLTILSDRVRVVDLEGLYLCPGLVDCHVHVTAVPGVKTMSEAVSLTFSKTKESELLTHRLGYLKMNLPNHVVNLRSTYVLRGNPTYAIGASELFVFTST